MWEAANLQDLREILLFWDFFVVVVVVLGFLVFGGFFVQLSKYRPASKF